MRMSLITAPLARRVSTSPAWGQAFLQIFFVTYYHKKGCTSAAGCEKMLASAGGLALG